MIKIFYDLETTGTDHRKHSIIELGGVVEVDNVIAEEFVLRMRPHEKALIEPAALRINNTTEEEIMEYPLMTDSIRVFKDMLEKYIDKYAPRDKIHLVGFNNRAFDDLFLRKWFELCGDRFFGSYFWADSLDVLVLASQYLLERRSGMPSFKLHRVATELGIVFDPDLLHSALTDSHLTREVYRRVTGLELEI